MSYISFSEYLPDLGPKETRWIVTVDDPVLPADRYGLVEMYCDENGCDCRRVFLSVYSDETTSSPTERTSKDSRTTTVFSGKPSRNDREDAEADAGRARMLL